MKRNLAIIIILPYLLITCGCAAVVLGIGAAAGTGAAYLSGKDARIYDSEYHQTAQGSAAELFDKSHKSRKQVEDQLDELYRQIGQLKVENDFLARKLGS